MHVNHRRKSNYAHKRTRWSSSKDWRKSVEAEYRMNTKRQMRLDPDEAFLVPVKKFKGTVRNWIMWY